MTGLHQSNTSDVVPIETRSGVGVGRSTEWPEMDDGGVLAIAKLIAFFWRRITPVNIDATNYDADEGMSWILPLMPPLSWFFFAFGRILVQLGQSLGVTSRRLGRVSDTG